MSAGQKLLDQVLLYLHNEVSSRFSPGVYFHQNCPSCWHAIACCENAKPYCQHVIASYQHANPSCHRVIASYQHVIVSYQYVIASSLYSIASFSAIATFL